MKRIAQILLWKFPKSVDLIVRVLCGMATVWLLICGVSAAIKGDSGNAAPYLLMGLVCATGMLPRRAA